MSKKEAIESQYKRGLLSERERDEGLRKLQGGLDEQLAEALRNLIQWAKYGLRATKEHPNWQEVDTKGCRLWEGLVECIEHGEGILKEVNQKS